MSDPYNYPGTSFKDSPTEYGGNFQYRVGLNHVGAYQVSGIPFVTASSAGIISFPYVTKNVTITNTGANPLNIGFSALGVSGSNKYVLNSSASLSLDVKVSAVYFSGSSPSYSLAAALTGIGTGSISSNWSGSAGVG
jgi:hypothetical protein